MLIIIQIVLVLVITVFSFIAGQSRGYRFGYKDCIDNNGFKHVKTGKIEARKHY